MEYALVNKTVNSARRNQVSINMLGPYFNGKLLEEVSPAMLEEYKIDRIEKRQNLERLTGIWPSSLSIAE